MEQKDTNTERINRLVKFNAKQLETFNKAFNGIMTIMDKFIHQIDHVIEKIDHKEKNIAELKKEFARFRAIIHQMLQAQTS